MRHVRRVLAISLFVAASACANRAGPSVSLYEAGDYAGAARAADEGLAAHPKDAGLWQMRVRSALALGDADGVARAYAGYRETRDDDDRELLRDLATATLGQALASPSVKLKLVAIEAIASAELQLLADQVAERMGDNDDRVAAAAAAAVLRGYPQAPQVAKEMMGSDDPEARRIAIDGVGKKVGKLALADLQKLAGSDPDARVRVAAIRWLGQLKDKESVELLARQLRHTDENVRAGAAQALARIATGDLLGFARKALADRALAVRLAGVELLAAARQPERDAELARLVEDPEPMVATEAAIALRRPELALKALERAMASESWTIRAGAANVAGRAVGQERALAIARKLAADGEPGVRLAAGRVLAYGGDRAAATAIFVEVLNGEHALAAATELAAIGDRRGLELLDQRVRDRATPPDDRARVAAAHRVANRVTPGLVAALADPSGVVRVEAAAAIVAIAKP